MSQWMKAAKNSRAAIIDISTADCSSTAMRKGQTENLQDKSQSLIEKLSAQFPTPTKKTESNEVGKSGDSKPKVNRRKGRRKSS